MGLDGYQSGRISSILVSVRNLPRIILFDMGKQPDCVGVVRIGQMSLVLSVSEG
jgi:hypothetical protein